MARSAVADGCGDCAESKVGQGWSAGGKAEGAAARPSPCQRVGALEVAGGSGLAGVAARTHRAADGGAPTRLATTTPVAAKERIAAHGSPLAVRAVRRVSGMAPSALKQHSKKHLPSKAAACENHSTEYTCTGDVHRCQLSSVGRAYD
jgi:hypothetical protein